MGTRHGEWAHVHKAYYHHYYIQCSLYFTTLYFKTTLDYKTA